MSSRADVTATDVRYAMRFPIRYEYDAASGISPAVTSIRQAATGGSDR